jgi:hypothetical protein
LICSVSKLYEDADNPHTELPEESIAEHVTPDA